MSITQLQHLGDQLGFGALRASLGWSRSFLRRDALVLFTANSAHRLIEGVVACDRRCWHGWSLIYLGICLSWIYLGSCLSLIYLGICLSLIYLGICKVHSFIKNKSPNSRLNKLTCLWHHKQTKTTQKLLKLHHKVFHMANISNLAYIRRVELSAELSTSSTKYTASLMKLSILMVTRQ